MSLGAIITCMLRVSREVEHGYTNPRTFGDGAAAAANCHPCMDFHLTKCDDLGIDREEVAAAVKVGLMVNRGAENAIRKKARELLGETAIEG